MLSGRPACNWVCALKLHGGHNIAMYLIVTQVQRVCGCCVAAVQKCDFDIQVNGIVICSISFDLCPLKKFRNLEI